MDDIVHQAMAKWPNVPDCYGWLGLDARGHWYLRDDNAQAQGNFTSGVTGSKGSLLQHEKLIEFIHRNYAVDISGQWYFQNGPQRVYVELEVTPWVWRVAGDYSVQAQTGAFTNSQRCFCDESGRVYLLTSLGFGLVHSWDVAIVAQAIEAGHWDLETVQKHEMAGRFGYIQSPVLQKSPLLKQ